MHGDLSGLWVVFLILGIMMIGRRRGFGRYAWGPGTRHLEQEIAELRTEQRSHALPRNAATQDQVQILEDRVRVLERIVTDRGYGLANEIEALRDRRAAHESEEKN